MAAFGSILHAIISYRENRKLLSKRKIRRLGDLHKEEAAAGQYEFVKLSEEEQSVLTTRIREDARIQRRQQRIRLIVSIGITVLILYLLVLYIELLS